MSHLNIVKEDVSYKEINYTESIGLRNFMTKCRWENEMKDMAQRFEEENEGLITNR